MHIRSHIAHSTRRNNAASRTHDASNYLIHTCSNTRRQRCVVNVCRQDSPYWHVRNLAYTLLHTARAHPLIPATASSSQLRTRTNGEGALGHARTIEINMSSSSQPTAVREYMVCNNYMGARACSSCVAARLCCCNLMQSRMLGSEIICTKVKCARARVHTRAQMYKIHIRRTQRNAHRTTVFAAR